MRVSLSCLALACLGCHALRPDLPPPVQQEWQLAEEMRMPIGDSGRIIRTQVSDVAFDASGRIYLIAPDVGAEGDSPILLYQADGKFLRHIGARGQGPGTFANPTGIVVGPYGALWVNDAPGNRIVVYDSSGAFVREFPRTTFEGIGGWHATIDSTGVLQELIRGPQAMGDPMESFLLHRLDPATGRQDTSAVHRCEPLNQVDRWKWNIEVGDRSMPVPYAPNPVERIDMRGVLWCATGDEYRIIAQRLVGGDSVATIARDDLPDVPVPSGERERFDRAVFSQTGKHLSSRELDRIPENQPRVESMATDDQGNLWVSRPGLNGGHHIDIWSRAGLSLARLEGPSEVMALRQIWLHEGKVYGVVYAKNGRPSLVRYRIVKP